mmetsp:Transcript_58022/g.131467  ORF Transcript_58022/g.131467 Transcript_58022/m.131467 type:complete len:344 (-) Transcript_58022:105-1136(-)
MPRYRKKPRPCRALGPFLWRAVASQKQSPPVGFWAVVAPGVVALRSAAAADPIPSSRTRTWRALLSTAWGRLDLFPQLAHHLLVPHVVEHPGLHAHGLAQEVGVALQSGCRELERKSTALEGRQRDLGVPAQLLGAQLERAAVLLYGRERDLAVGLDRGARVAQSLEPLCHGRQHGFRVALEPLACELEGHGVVPHGRPHDLRVVPELGARVLQGVAAAPYRRADHGFDGLQPLRGKLKCESFVKTYSDLDCVLVVLERRGGVLEHVGGEARRLDHEGLVAPQGVGRETEAARRVLADACFVLGDGGAHHAFVAAHRFGGKLEGWTALLYGCQHDLLVGAQFI